MSILYSIKPIVEEVDLAEAIKNELNISLNISNLLFGESNNQSYRDFEISKPEQYIYPKFQNLEEIEYRNMIRNYLKRYFPGHDKILIHMKW